ncbi:MAG: class I SAM-dependent methyltransferase [Roseovarius sp.]|nr:class I SAM-dependent methyltransferase [Roseovarius sp.]
MADTQFWDRVARRYAARPIGNMAAYETTLERTRAYLRDTDQVLELGCGTGSTALLLAPGVEHLTASDLSGEMIAIANEKLADFEGDNLEFRQSDVFDAGFAPGGFDAVLAFNFLHLLDGMDPTLARVHSLLKPGGLFISKTICLGRHAWHFRALIGLLRLVRKAPPAVNFLDAGDVQSAIRAAGFVIEETGDYPVRLRAHFIVARKLADPSDS